VRGRPGVESLEDRWLPSISEFPLPTLSFPGSTGALGITSGSDGNVWFSDTGLGEVGRITPSGQVTEFIPPFHSAGVITTGPDGNVWFSSLGLNFTDNIAKITPAGQITTYQLPGMLKEVSGLTAGPDGNVWFTENDYPSGEKVGRITPTGQITEFAVPNAPAGFGGAGSITTGPDGNLYFLHAANLARISPTGAITDHVADGVGGGLTVGPDGNLWATGAQIDQQTGAVLGSVVNRITLNGVVTTFNVGASALPGPITAGPDGNLYFTLPDANQIGRVTTVGQVTLFDVPTAASGPTGITAGPNGNIWFTEQFERQIGELFLTGTPPAPAAATATALAIDVAAPTVGQTVHLTATVTSAAGAPTGSVTFFDGVATLGAATLDTSGHAVLSTVFHTSGSHRLSAGFTGSPTFAPSLSGVVTAMVSQASTTTALTASANPAPVGKPLTLTVNVTPSFTGAGAPSGTIILVDGVNTIGFASLDATGKAVFHFIPGQSIHTTNGRLIILPRGLHHLTAKYTGDGNFAPSVSLPLDLTVV
jgi:virginiamycin B lyase